MDSKEQKVIQAIAEYVKSKFSGEHTGHDWWHVYRVWQIAKKISENEKANNYIVQLGALLHDVADHKLVDEEKGLQEIRDLLVSHFVKETEIAHVINIVKRTSFKGALVEDNPLTIEAKIVQDADRLDAIGAIGIARTFAYGGNKKREIYNPDIKPQLHNSFSEYKKSTAPTINHFYEKLLLLKDRMHTQTGKQMAEERHQFMEMYLKQFYKEWGNN